MRRVLVIQHVADEPPLAIADVLAAKGISVDIMRVDRGDPVPTTLASDGLVIMGGPMGVADTARLPHLGQEITLLRDALAQGKPILGVCLGSQLLAAALGARVSPGPAKEIGWYPVTLEPAAQGDALFGAAPREFVGFHWHGDVFELPAGAMALARSERTAVQAFRHGRAWGILFHLEVSREAVQTFTRVFADELAAEQLDGAAIVAAANDHCATLEHVGRDVFARWAELVLTLGPERTPFLDLGGAAVVHDLAMRFYDAMEAHEPALTALHECEAPGKVSRAARERFALFLAGWLGGPQDYTAQHGPPRLRMRHREVPVDAGMRDAWLRAMTLAMDGAGISGDVRRYLDARFAEVANFLRNID